MDTDDNEMEYHIKYLIDKLSYILFVFKKYI